MSIFQGLALILFSSIFVINALLRLTSMMDVYIDTILTGVLRGIPISKEHRWMTVYQQWLPLAGNAIVFSALQAGGMVLVANHVDNGGVRALAFAAAAWAGVAALMWLVMCFSGIIYFRSVLQTSTRD